MLPNNVYFLESNQIHKIEGPQQKLSKLAQLTTPKKRYDYSTQQLMRTLPDERTTTNNMSTRRADSGSEQGIVFNYHNAFKVLESRLNLIQQLALTLTNNQDYDVAKILNTIQQIAQTLKSASKNEIELNQKAKQLNKSTLESIQQRSVIQQLREQHNHFKLDNQEQARKLHLTQQDQMRLQKDFFQQKQLNEEQYKKIRCLEKRIEMMLEKNLSTHQDELRITLAELIKDNEQLKRVVIKKDKEIERLKELNQKLIQQNSRLTKKLDNLKTKKIGNKAENLSIEEFNNQYSNDNYAFDPNQLPQNLDFRLVTLTQEENDVLVDLVEHGADVFTSQVIQLDSLQQRKELIHLVANQYKEQREFTEKINLIMNEFVTLISYRNIQDFQIHISKAFKLIFQTDVVHLWIVDGMTCRAYTHDSSGQKIVCLLTDGIFAKLIFEDLGIQSPQQEKKLLYVTDTNHKIFGSNFLLLPILMNSQKPCGFLEIQNINEDQHIDMQYYGLLVNMLSKSVINSILNYEALYKELKYQDLFTTAFTTLALAQNKEEFENKVQQCALSIFQIAQAQLIFIENNQFKRGGKFYSLGAGCASVILKMKKQQIFTQITKHQCFDENVDISSILPIFAGPLFLGEKVDVILEFILKQKKIQDQHQFGSQIPQGFKSNSLDHDAQKFYEIVNKAYFLAFHHH